MKALIIIDMLKDFVDGALANERAQEIIEPIQGLLAHARANPDEWIVVFSNDAHYPTDPELRVWGEHAMAGTPGAEVIDALAPRDAVDASSWWPHYAGRLAAEPHEFIAPKQAYGAFTSDRLPELLGSLGVDEVVLVGQHTHICVRHTSYEALTYGFDISVPIDAVCAFEGVDEDAAFEYLHDVYGAKLTTTDALIEASVAA